MSKHWVKEVANNNNNEQTTIDDKHNDKENKSALGSVPSSLSYRQNSPTANPQKKHAFLFINKEKVHIINKAKRE